MKLDVCMEIGQACGLHTVKECYDNISLHGISIFSDGEIAKELLELQKDIFYNDPDEFAKIFDGTKEEMINRGWKTKEQTSENMLGMDTIRSLRQEDKEEGDVQREKETPVFEQKKEQLKNMIKEIGENFETDPDMIAEAVAFGQKFYRYSANNILLMYKQNPYCQYVQSFQKWNDRGVAVKKGEHGMSILVPVETTYLKVNDKYIPLRAASEGLKDAYRKHQIESKTEVHFRVGTVFDISQTTFPKERYPELFHMGYTSKEARSICEGLAEFSRTELNCPVEAADLKSIRLRGLCFTELPKIQYNELLEDTERLSTLQHELSHTLIHHKDGDGKFEAQREFEADALSIMFQSHYGVELTDSRKRHLAEAYKSVKEKRPEFDINVCLNRVFQVYRKNIETMDKYVAAQIKLEKEPPEHTDPMEVLMKKTVEKRSMARVDDRER